jgi:hypothetical protein
VVPVLLVLFPLLLLVHTRLALVALALAIVMLVVKRTRPQGPKPMRRPPRAETAYKAGYED